MLWEGHVVPQNLMGVQNPHSHSQVNIRQEAQVGLIIVMERPANASRQRPRLRSAIQSTKNCGN